MEHDLREQNNIPKVCPFNLPECIATECVGWMILTDFEGCFLSATARAVQGMLEGVRRSQYYDPAMAFIRAIDAVKSGDKVAAANAMEEAVVSFQNSGALDVFKDILNFGEDDEEEEDEEDI